MIRGLCWTKMLYSAGPEKDTAFNGSVAQLVRALL